MKNLFEPLFKLVHGRDAGLVGGIVGLVIGLLLVIFGFWKTIFVIICAILGYIIGANIFKNSDNFRELLNKIFPPGKYR